MEKIININFQGRVIPIEETAYNNLKQYVDGLRAHFANEESSDEIINDIENRIAELLSDRVKRGIGCINNNDLSAVIDSIGRLEDIEAAEGEEKKAPPQAAPYNPGNNAQAFKGRFFRNDDDKVIAGICSSIAIRSGVDPLIVRILFVLLFGALFWVYILLWIIVPAQSIQTNVTRRLYRNPNDKIIAGVCGGLAVYFRMESRTIRLIFGLPFLIGLFLRSVHAFWWHWGWSMGPRIVTGSFGSSLLILYIILWIAIPFASSASDQLEMRGEKIDLNSIKATAQANSVVYPPRRPGGIARAIGILFKSFFLFIAGTISISLFAVLIGLIFAGSVAIPFSDFLISGWWQYMMLWAGIALLLGIPFLALATWIVRRMMGVRSQRHYLGSIFSGLWLIGFISMVVMVSICIGNFRSRSIVEEGYPMSQPSTGRLYINVSNDQVNGIRHHYGRWFSDWDDNDAPFRMLNGDSLWLNTVKVEVAQSDDSLFHIYKSRTSRGNTSAEAKDLAGHISFDIAQHDSVITLPMGFSISKKDKFRNQQVLITVEVPVGKAIEFSKEINKYTWYNINVDGHRSFRFERHWDFSRSYRNSSKYIMTPSGLKNPLDSTDLNGDENEDDDNDN